MPSVSASSLFQLSLSHQNWDPQKARTKISAPFYKTQVPIVLHLEVIGSEKSRLEGTSQGHLVVRTLHPAKVYVKSWCCDRGAFDTFCTQVCECINAGQQCFLFWLTSGAPSHITWKFALQVSFHSWEKPNWFSVCDWKDAACSANWGEKKQTKTIWLVEEIPQAPSPLPSAKAQSDNASLFRHPC